MPRRELDGAAACGPFAAMANDAPLSSGFEVPPRAAWIALVEKTLSGAPLDSLAKATAEGLAIAPLYAPSNIAAAPARAPGTDRAWDLRTATAHPDPVQANAEILADLAGGAASALLRIEPTGGSGVAAGSADDLARALKDVILELAPVGLDAGFLGPQAADWLNALAKASPGALLQFHLDPLSAFAETGASPGPIESHLVSAATVGARLAQTYPKAGVFLASGRVVHEAGGGEAQEIAFAASSAVAYAKALVRAGLPMAEAFGRITLGLSVDADYFVSLAKLRAARAVWARIASACGADPVAQIEARSSRRMLAAKDAWTNMIRLTAAGFAGVAGGADAIVLGGFTDALGLPTAFARRQSRNIQLVLMEEAHVGRVSDPGAGSGYVEALTDEMARAAWAAFQEIQAQGDGLVGALREGRIARAVEAVVATRPEPKLVGVNAFPPTVETPIEVARPAAKPAKTQPSPRLPGPDSHCPPLAPIRLAEPLEAAA
jgi:methylmalonyl-CoA mutase